MESFNHLFIVTHTDLDGAGAAAAALRITGRKVDEATIVFAEPYNLDRKLGELVDHVSQGDLTVIADLGVNKQVFNGIVDSVRKIAEAGARVEWYDHHVWSDEEVAALREAGALVVVDRSTCATGVVARHMARFRGVNDEFLTELEAAVCAADLWRWDHHMAPKLFRVAGDRGDEEWKRKLIEKLASGVLWDEELEAKLEEYVNEELSGFNKVLSTVYVGRVDGYTVAVAYKRVKGPPGSSMIGASLLSRYDSDVAGIVRGDGGLSLRSRRVNVQVIAKLLGGGGHPAAAGAKIGIPLPIRLLGLVYPRAVSWYAFRVIAGALREAARS